MSTASFKKNISRLALTALVGSTLFYNGIANADEVKVNLTGAEETPAVKTSAVGSGTIIVNEDKTVSGSVTTQGLNGTAAHIHVGAAGQKGPPVVSLIKSGNGVWTVPSGTTLTDEQYASYKAGNLYINVHSAENKSGEIRGQLKS